MEIYDIGAKAEVFKKIYGADFNSAVSTNCEMANLWVRKNMSPPDIAKNYFLGGKKSFNRLNEILIGLDFPLSEVKSYCDFACGFGRTTRFFIQQIPIENVTVADISADAVAFQKEQFGVKGFVSSKLSSDLSGDGHRDFDLMTVNSLFSHFNHDYWTKWLEALLDLMRPGGIILFSTHGAKAFNKRNDGQKKKMMAESPETGFYFWARNETLGRLEENYYGTSYVMPDWVEAQVKKIGKGEIVAAHNPLLGFMGGQDVYAVKKS